MVDRKVIRIRQDDGTRRRIGVYENGVFTSDRRESEHLYRKLDAWGIDTKAFEGLMQDFNLQEIVVHDIETGVEYSTTPDVFIEHGEYLHFKPHRAQVFLPREYWKKSLPVDYEEEEVSDET